MERRTIKPFEEIKDTNDILILDWFGGIYGNLQEEDNPYIDCYFTPLVNKGIDEQTGKPKYYRSLKDQFRAGIAVGYLPSLQIGQYFNSNGHAPHSKWSNRKTITFQLDTSDPESIVDCFISDLQLTTSSDLTSYKFKSASDKAHIKALNGHLLTSNKNSIPSTVYIHDMEIIRFYLTNSSHSCKNLFSGAFQNDRLLVKVYNDIHEEPEYNHETGRCRFVYRFRYTYADRYALSRILSEPDNHALKAAQKVYKSITSDTLNLASGTIGYPKTHFPFKRKTQLSVSGRYLDTQSGKIFFIEKIESCSSPFLFKHLSCCSELEPGGKPPPEDAKEAFKNGKPSEKGPAHNNKNDKKGHSSSNQKPSSNSITLHAEVGDRILSGISALTEDKSKLRDCTHKTAKKRTINNDNLKNTSTGNGTSGESDTTKQSLSEKNITHSGYAPCIDSFLLELQSLRNKRVGKFKDDDTVWHISTIKISSGFQDENGEWHSYFPCVPCEIMTNQIRQFSFMDDNQFIRRRFIAVEVNIKNRYLYLFEAEKRERDKSSKENKTEYKENMPTLVLYNENYKKCEPDNFKDMIKNTVKQKQWADGTNHTFYFKGQIQTAPNNSRLSYGKGHLLFDKICSHIRLVLLLNSR